MDRGNAIDGVGGVWPVTECTLDGPHYQLRNLIWGWSEVYFDHNTFSACIVTRPNYTGKVREKKWALVKGHRGSRGRPLVTMGLRGWL